MKKMIGVLLALAVMLCGVAMAATLAPQDPGFNENEGTYPAAFKREDLKDGVLNGIHLLTVDMYATEEVEKLAVGDELVFEGKPVAINTLEKKGDDYLLINGGYEKDGITLYHNVPDPEFLELEYPECWLSIEDDDYHTYTDHGTFNLPLAEDVTFTDKWELDMAAIEAGQKPLVAQGIEAVTRAIAESENDSFYENNTEVVIRDGRIAEIIRQFTP